MTNLTASFWKPLAAGHILDLPLFYNADLVEAGALAKSCPYATKDEILVVRILNVINYGLSADVFFVYVNNITGEEGPMIMTLQATAREIQADRASVRGKVSRKLWTLVKDSIRIA